MEVAIVYKEVCTICGESFVEDSTDDVFLRILPNLMKISYTECHKCSTSNRIETKSRTIQCIHCDYEYDYPSNHEILTCNTIPMCETCIAPLQHKCRQLKPAIK